MFLTVGVIFIFYVIFSMKFLCANRIAPAGTPHSAASHLGLDCLPMSHKRDGAAPVAERLRALFPNHSIISPL